MVDFADEPDPSFHGRGPSPAVLLVAQGLKWVAGIVGFSAATLVIASLAGKGIESWPLRLAVGAFGAAVLPLVITDRVLRIEGLYADRRVGTDALAVILLVQAFVLVILLDRVTSPLLVAEGDRLHASGFERAATVAFWLGGVSPVAPPEAEATPAASSQAAPTPSASVAVPASASASVQASPPEPPVRPVIPFSDQLDKVAMTVGTLWFGNEAEARWGGSAAWVGPKHVVVAWTPQTTLAPVSWVEFGEGAQRKVAPVSSTTLVDDVRGIAVLELNLPEGWKVHEGVALALPASLPKGTKLRAFARPSSAGLAWREVGLREASAPDALTLDLDLPDAWGAGALITNDRGELVGIRIMDRGGLGPILGPQELGAVLERAGVGGAR